MKSRFSTREAELTSRTNFSIKNEHKNFINSWIEHFFSFYFSLSNCFKVKFRKKSQLFFNAKKKDSNKFIGKNEIRIRISLRFFFFAIERKLRVKDYRSHKITFSLFQHGERLSRSNSMRKNNWKPNLNLFVVRISFDFVDYFLKFQKRN